MKNETGVVSIRGKSYQTVALRVHNFREVYPDHSLTTEILHRDLDCVVMRAVIADPAGRVMATGHAEEYRKASDINRTSAVENCETSAIGRALAAFGLGGTEFASADEVARAVTGSKGEPPTHNAPRMAFDALQPEVQDHLRRSVPQVVSCVAAGNVSRAIEVIEMIADNWPQDDTIKPAVWSLLDSATRSAIKKHQQQKEAA